MQVPVENYTRDLEDEQSLNADDQEPVEFWAAKQKELVISVVDYNLGTLVDLIGDRTIDLEPRYQRRLRWDSAKQSKLIESFLMNVPIPPVFLNEDEYGRFSVIDGKQRLASIYQFFMNNLVLEKLEVFSDIAGLKFNDLPAKLRNILRTRPTLRATIILRQSDPDIKYEVFQRLNTGGTHLNPQEIRNNAFHGSLNDLIMGLSESKIFHYVLGIRNKYKSAIYQEMRDAELVLRYFTFRNSWRTFRGGIRREMDRFMELNRNPDEETLVELEQDFCKTLSTVEHIFGRHCFQRWMPERRSWRRYALASLYDAQMFACRDFDKDQLEPHKNAIISEFQELFDDEEFRRSIDAATNTPALFKQRIRSIQYLLQKIVGP